MRSVVAGAAGEPSEVLHLQSHPIPEPGPGRVRIRVAAAPVNASDLHTIRGRYGFTPESPTAPGIESVGVIDELGSGTDGLTVGQRVITVGVRGTRQAGAPRLRWPGSDQDQTVGSDDAEALKSCAIRGNADKYMSIENGATALSAVSTAMSAGGTRPLTRAGGGQ